MLRLLQRLSIFISLRGSPSYHCLAAIEIPTVLKRSAVWTTRRCRRCPEGRDKRAGDLLIRIIHLIVGCNAHVPRVSWNHCSHTIYCGPVDAVDEVVGEGLDGLRCERVGRVKQLGTFPSCISQRIKPLRRPRRDIDRRVGAFS